MSSAASCKTTTTRGVNCGWQNEHKKNARLRSKQIRHSVRQQLRGALTLNQALFEIDFYFLFAVPRLCKYLKCVLYVPGIHAPCPVWCAFAQHQLLLPLPSTRFQMAQQATRCTPTTRWCRRGRSSWCETFRGEVGRCARKCGRRSSRAAPG